MNVVAVIHARGGSKRIPLKNIQSLGGKPLIAYAIGAALGARTVQRVIVSTDHPEIRRVAEEYGAEVPFVRPPDISEDVASELVTQHAVTYLEEQEGYQVGIAVTIQPSTPFCTSADIDGCVRLLLESDADSAWSGREVQDRPEWMYSIDGEGYAQSLLGTEMTGDVGVSQTLPRLFVPNGGIYATRRTVLFGQNSIFGRVSRIWVMPRLVSMDIDEAVDLEFADFLVRTGRI
ncbi:MAG: acylneuraminate cytidylyltransferase family protein [Methanomicrobiales archaeon]|nr:acylneuraminate cytidylyltransferase family protein [Methanomicrobiales archaeon]